MEGEGMRVRLLHLLRSRSYRPLNKSEFARHLGVGSGERALLRAELARLEREGLIVSGKKGRYELVSAEAGRVTGVLRFHPKGHAWFYPERVPGQEGGERLYVGRRDTGTALDGDRVSVRLERRGHPGRRRGRALVEDESPRARVEQVLERRSGRVTGLYRKQGRHAWVEADDPGVQGVVELTADTTALPGQLVVVELEQWQGRHLSPRGRVLEILGWPGDAGVDILAVIHRHGLATAFPPEVVAAAREVGEEITADERARRDDWTGRMVVTIDPADAKDHDDAIHVAAVDGGWELAVHIADVSHHVKPGGALDAEARRRGNSTYLVDRVLPMLPAELSNGVCSLKPGVERLTKCVLIRVDTNGGVRAVAIRDAVIRSARKLSYEEAQELLDGPEAGDGVAGMLREAWRMASAMRARRFARGALDLDFPEVRVELDERGRPSRVAKVEHTASHRLIEECMLAANEVVAKLLRERQRPAVFRVHEDPDAGKLFEFAALARSFGHEPGDLSNRKHVQRLLDEIRGLPHEHAVKLGLLKSLQRAAYAADSLGHYGLAKVDYCHFTSPIRRYADLLVHRALQPLLGNPPREPDATLAYGELGGVARHISDTERNSAEAEEETRQVKLLEYLEDAAGAAEPPVFAGVVTDVRLSGLLVEAVDIGVRGLVKREDLPRGQWRFDAARMRYVERGGGEVRLGQRLGLLVAAVNPARGFVDFRLSGG